MKVLVKVALVAALMGAPVAAHAEGFAQIETGLDAVKFNGASAEGLHYGMAIGYDLPVSETVFVGLQASLVESTLNSCESSGTSIACMATGRDMAVQARLGTKIGARSKVFVTGGYANARLRFSVDSPSVAVSGNLTADGYRLGAGYQYDLGNSLYLGAEYRYANLEGDFVRHNGVVTLGARF